MTTTNHMTMLIAIAVPLTLAAPSLCAKEGQHQYDEEVITIGARTKQPTFTVAHATSRIDNQDIREHIYRTTPEALVNQPGVLVQKTAHGHGSAFIRGLTGKQVLILIDGMRLNNSTFRFGPNQYLNTIDPHNIDHIELLRGPASSLYGSDAIGGVINIVTQSEPHGDHHNSEVRGIYGSSDNERSISFSTGGRSGHWHYHGSFGKRSFGDLTGGGNVGEQDYTGYKERHLNGSVGYDLDSGGSLSLRIHDTEQSDVPRTDKFVYSAERQVFDLQERQTLNLTASVPIQSSFADHLQIQILKQRQSESLTRNKFGSDLIRRTIDQVDTQALYLQLETSFSKSRLLYGAELYQDEVDSEGQRIDGSTVAASAGSFPDNAKYRSQAGFIQLTTNLGESSILTTGLRYSHFKALANLQNFGKLNEQYSDLTASIQLSSELVSGWRLFGGVASGFRAPNLDDLAVLKSTNEGIDVPSPGLAPEQVLNYELGLKHANKRWQGTAVVFLSTFEDLIERRLGTYLGLAFIDDNGNGIRDNNEDAVVQKFNIGEARMRGIELDGAISLTKNISLNGSVTYISGEGEDEPLSRVPPLQATIGLRAQSDDGRWWGNLTFNTSRRQNRLSTRDQLDPRIPSQGTPGFAVFDLASGWNIGQRHKINIALNNLADRKYKYHGSGVYQPGRSFKVSYAINL